MSIGVDAAEEKTQRRLLVPALVICTMAVNVSIAILQLFLVDIGATFHVSVGVASQLATVNHAGEFFAALLMGALVVRFRYKPLMLGGLLIVLFSALGSFFAPDFSTMQFFFALEGMGTVMFTAMSFTVVGDVFAPPKRAKAVSYLMAALFAMALVGSPLSGMIANVVGWRSNFLLQALPLCAVAVGLALFVVPSKLQGQKAISGKVSLAESFKQVLKDKSAVACLTAHVLAPAASTRLIFSIAFYRERFLASRDFTVVISMVSLAVFVAGSLAAGRLTNKFGAKPVAVTAAALASIFLTMFFFIPNLFGTLILDFLTVCFASISLTSATCLALAQVPQSRSTMMSLNSATEALGTTIGPAVGGGLLILVPGFYGAVGLALGGVLAASALILFVWAEDPTKT